MQALSSPVSTPKPTEAIQYSSYSPNMTISFPLPKSLALLSILLPLLCFTSIHATHVPGHYGFPAAIVPTAACSYLNAPIWSPYHAVSPFYSNPWFSPSILAPYTSFNAPAFAIPAVGAPFFSQLQANQLFNQLQANQFFNQQQANQLFQQQQANQAFNQIEANQLFNQQQANQAFNQQQANQLFLNAQLANYLLYPRGGCCPGSYSYYPSTGAILV